MHKTADLLVIFCVLFFSYALAQLASTVATFGLKPCYRVNFSEVSLSVERERVLSVDLEKVGFFYSGRKTVKEEKTEVQSEEVYTFDNYVLKGTIVCSRCEHSIAILGDKKSGKSLTITVGQEVKGFKVVAIYPERVVLKGNGKTLTLKLFEKSSKTSNLLSSADRKLFKVERKQVIEEISSGNFLKYISIVPSDNPKGLKVTYVNRRSFIYKLGIRPGDIITSINDIRIRTPEDSFSAFEQLKNSDSVTITVLRNGKEVKLHYELE